MTIDAVVERVSNGGNLLANLGLIKSDTWETSQEVFKAWQKGAPVVGVSTANMGVYRLVGGEAVFDLLGREGNLFVDDKFREGAYNGIVDTEFFFPQGEMKQHVLSAIGAKQSVTINYSGLSIETEDCSSSCGYVEAGEKNTDEEKKLFSAVYGIDNPGSEKRVYLLRGNVVKAQLEDKKDNLVVRACYFSNFQYFSADGRYFDSYSGAVRGVRRIVAAGAKKTEVPVALQEAPKLATPTMEQLLAISRPYVLECDWSAFQDDLRKLYKQ